MPRVPRTAELDLFRLYLEEVGRHPLLTAEDEIELSQAYQAGLDAEGKLARALQRQQPGLLGNLLGGSSSGQGSGLLASPAARGGIAAMVVKRALQQRG